MLEKININVLKGKIMLPHEFGALFFGLLLGQLYQSLVIYYKNKKIKIFKFSHISPAPTNFQLQCTYKFPIIVMLLKAMICFKSTFPRRWNENNTPTSQTCHFGQCNVRKRNSLVKTITYNPGIFILYNQESITKYAEAYLNLQCLITL